MRTRTRAGSAGAAFERVEEALHNAVELIRKLPEHIELTEYSQRIEKRLGACNNNPAARGTERRQC